jgi:hypothetical protein
MKTIADIRLAKIYQTRADYRAQFGVDPPPFNASHPIKRWLGNFGPQYDSYVLNVGWVRVNADLSQADIVNIPIGETNEPGGTNFECPVPMQKPDPMKWREVIGPLGTVSWHEIDDISDDSPNGKIEEILREIRSIKKALMAFADAMKGE